MANPSKIQNSFTGGEIAPALYGRTDLAKWSNGCSVLRNFFVSYRGGASSRAGLRYVGTCLQSGYGPPPRDINFQFNINQGYALEFGDNVVTRSVIDAADNGDGLIRITLDTTQGLMTGFSTVISGVVGTTEANGTWTITVIDDTDIDLQDSAFSNAYVSGGTAVTSNAGYMRIKSNGAYVVEDAQAITAITKANPGVFSYTSSDYDLFDGDWVYLEGIGGMTEFNNLTWIVDNATSSTFTLKDLFGNPVNTLGFSTYTSGGTLSRIYTVPAPYAATDLPFLKFAQSADTMSLCCVNQDTRVEYPTYDLVRNGATDWVFTQVTFDADIAPPTNLAVTASSSTTPSTYYSYVVTAVSAANGEESIASDSAQVINNNISINAGSNLLTWDTVVGADSYNIYRAIPQYGTPVPEGVLYGFIGTSMTGTFVDNNILADFTTVPPLHKNPFARNAITDVTITAGGVGYTQSNVGYTITTALGTGFVGSPVVANGEVVSFVIQSNGQNYGPSDTITITGGGGATGYFTFSENPDNTDNMVINGVTWTFVATGPTNVAETLVQSTLAGTLAQLALDLTASPNALLTVAEYTATSTRLNIIYKTSGVGGNAYTLANGTAPVTRSGATLSGGASSGGATATLTIGDSSGTYPGVVAYFQQRRVYAYTLNRPDTYFMSQPGAYTNFDYSIPITDSDSITGTPWAQQVNGIQALQPMTNGLITLTGNGAWLLNGGDGGAAITPSSQVAQSQAYNGCHDNIPPIVVNYDILYVQSKGSIVRDLAYNFYTNVFTGTDMTVLSSHLFNYRQLQQWAYCEEPYKTIWGARDDGVMLCLTYLKEQDVYAWSRHDTNGFFVGTCSVTEPPVDALYCIVKRYVNGQWKYYSERMDNRNWTSAENSFCVDAGLSTTLTYPNATLTPSAAEGTGNITSVNIINGGSGYTAPTIEAISDTGTGATFSVSLSGGVITSVTVLTDGEGYIAGAVDLRIEDTTGSGATLHAVVTNYVTFNTDASVFSADNEGDIIRIGNNNASVSTGITISGAGKAEIVEYVSATEVVANIIEPITAVIYDNEEAQPVPAIANQWSLATPVSVINGLNHLEGMTVAILADGGVLEQQTVISGSVQLDTPASLVTVGLPYTCQIQSTYLASPDVAGGLQGKRKNINSIVARVEASRGFTVGTNQPVQSAQPGYANIPWTNMKSPKERNALIEAGNAIPLHTGDVYINVPSEWDEYSTSAVEQKNPLPCNLLALVSTFMVGDN